MIMTHKIISKNVLPCLLTPPPHNILWLEVIPKRSSSNAP
jgi:hypothetical protein